MKVTRIQRKSCNCDAYPFCEHAPNSMEKQTGQDTKAQKRFADLVNSIPGGWAANPPRACGDTGNVVVAANRLHDALALLIKKHCRIQNVTPGNEVWSSGGYQISFSVLR